MAPLDFINIKRFLNWNYWYWACDIGLILKVMRTYKAVWTYTIYFSVVRVSNHWIKKLMHLFNKIQNSACSKFLDYDLSLTHFLKIMIYKAKLKYFFNFKLKSRLKQMFINFLYNSFQCFFCWPQRKETVYLNLNKFVKSSCIQNERAFVKCLNIKSLACMYSFVIR